jgi:formylglycine-generating enzyme required for sulfatase activity
MIPKFFITHAWKDIEFARRLYYDLRANSIEGFFDERSIKAGERIPDKIQQGLEGCDVYLPVLSRVAFESPWCKDEISLAIMLTNDRARNGRPQIIPILIDDCIAELKKVAPILTTRSYLTLEDSYDNLLYRLLTEVFDIARPLLPPKTPPPAPPAEPKLQTPSSAASPKLAPRPADSLPARQAEAAPRQSVPHARDEIIQLYNDARALQSAGGLRPARDAFQTVVASAPEYRDAALRLKKLELYLNADDLMQQALADKEDKPDKWIQAAARLEELLGLDLKFLDTQAKLETCRGWIALEDAYEHLLDALENDDWVKALALFEQIRTVKPTYRRTQALFERAWPQIVQAGATKKIGKDGKEMILIPAGEFLMGSEENDNEKPPHKVYLDAFYIDRYPVTNAKYKKFVDAAKHQPPSHWQNGQIPSGKDNHPVVNVTWNDAVAYAQWAGGRLPTEAEWEKAASWDLVNQRKRTYPWSDEFDASKCNTAESGIKDTTPVGKYSPQGDSPYGVGDMAGNVWEWCADWYDENYYKNSPVSQGSTTRNPQGPSSGQYRVVRGGAWDGVQWTVRCACRGSNGPDLFSDNIGFRVLSPGSDISGS